MATLKRLFWQLCGVLLSILNLLRFCGCIYFGVKTIKKSINLVRISFDEGSLSSVEWQQWLVLLGFILGGCFLWFLGGSFRDLKEWNKDKVLNSTRKYYSYETICKFEKDYKEGNLSTYSDIDKHFLEKELFKNYERSVHPPLDKRKNKQKKEENPVTSNEDSERVISQDEINGFTKKGYAHPQKELDKLIGLAPVKEKIERLRTRFEFDKMRSSKKKFSVCNHLCFYGAPGTGKTTVARIMSGFLYELKIIKKNQVVEVNGTDLMGQYLGYTAKRTKRIIDAARGGVLFIDEAYSLVSGVSSGLANSYGQEALAELVKAMEDAKDDIVIIFAGYPKDMNDFFNINAGMKSRIKDYIEFPNYSAQEMGEILVHMAKAQDYTVSDELKNEFINYSSVVLLPGPNFANARSARESLDEIIDRHAKNIITGATDKSQMNHLSLSDFPWFKEEK